MSESRNEHRRWENRTVVREVDRHRARWYWGIFLGLALAVAPGAIYVSEQNRCVKLQYHARELRKDYDALLETERRLSARRTELETLAGIETWAIERRGLERPPRERKIVVRRSTAGTEGVLARGPEAASRIH